MKYNGCNLKEVLVSHKQWLFDIFSEKDRADLIEADLSEANLRGANLSGVDLRGADLSGADLSVANLRGANLSEANLRGANLIEADLRRADLIEADLSGAHLRRACLIKADLSGADLRRAYLIEADLIEADLSGANLRRACLIKADLSEANLSEANLIEADLSGAKNIPFIPLTCPDTGAFVSWKKCMSKNGKVIVKLLIPEDAKRVSGTGRKCRADRAIVLEIQTIDGDMLEGVMAWSMYDKNFTYEVGKTVTPNEPFCEDRFEECSSGIHFFINRRDAVKY